MLRFRSLASGSSGNATLIEAHDGLHPTRVLIDCGLARIFHACSQRRAQRGIAARI